MKFFHRNDCCLAFWLRNDIHNDINVSPMLFKSCKIKAYASCDSDTKPRVLWSHRMTSQLSRIVKQVKDKPIPTHA